MQDRSPVRNVFHRARLFEERLAENADRRILPALLTLLLTADLAFAGNWTFSPERDLTSPAYQVGKLIAPMHVWGSTLAVLAVVAAFALILAGRRWLTGYLIGPVIGLAFWGSWSVWFGLSYGAHGASLFGFIAALTLALLHALAGLAVTRRAPAVDLCLTDRA